MEQKRRPGANRKRRLKEMNAMFNPDDKPTTEVGQIPTPEPGQVTPTLSWFGLYDLMTVLGDAVATLPPVLRVLFNKLHKGLGKFLGVDSDAY